MLHRECGYSCSLFEQGAVSANKCTRGNGRRDLFDHTLSKEIFDSGSSLPFFLYLTSDFTVGVGRMVKQLPKQALINMNRLKSLGNCGNSALKQSKTKTGSFVPLAGLLLISLQPLIPTNINIPKAFF